MFAAPVCGVLAPSSKLKIIKDKYNSTLTRCFNACVRTNPQHHLFDTGSGVRGYWSTEISAMSKKSTQVCKTPSDNHDEMGLLDENMR